MRKEPSYAQLHRVASAIPKYHSVLSAMHKTVDKPVQMLHMCQYNINLDNIRTFRHKIKQTQCQVLKQITRAAISWQPRYTTGLKINVGVSCILQFQKQSGNHGKDWNIDAAANRKFFSYHQN